MALTVSWQVIDNKLRATEPQRPVPAAISSRHRTPSDALSIRSTVADRRYVMNRVQPDSITWRELLMGAAVMLAEKARLGM